MDASGGTSADDVARLALEDDVAFVGSDADEDEGDSVSSLEAGSGGEQSGSDSESGECADFRHQGGGVSRLQKGGSRGRRGGGRGGRGGRGESAGARTSRGSELKSGGTQHRSGSKSKPGKLHATRGNRGVAGSSATVSGFRSQTGKSNADLPKRMQNFVQAANKRPKGLHAQDRSKCQSRPASKKSKRAADAGQIDNPWLSAAVAVGEGSVDDAMALADFVVALPDRDYDSLLRSRYWPQTNQGSPATADKPKKREKS